MAVLSGQNGCVKDEMVVLQEQNGCVVKTKWLCYKDEIVVL